MGLFTKSTTSPAAPAVTPEIPAEPKTISPAVSNLIAPVPAPLSPVPAPAARIIMSPQNNERQGYLQGLKVRIHQKLVERLDVQNLRSMPAGAVRGEVRALIRDLCQSEKGLINGSDQEKLMDDVMD